MINPEYLFSMFVSFVDVVRMLTARFAIPFPRSRQNAWDTNDLFTLAEFRASIAKKCFSGSYFNNSNRRIFRPCVLCDFNSAKLQSAMFQASDCVNSISTWSDISTPCEWCLQTLWWCPPCARIVNAAWTINTIADNNTAVAIAEVACSFGSLNPKLFEALLRSSSRSELNFLSFQKDWYFAIHEYIGDD